MRLFSALFILILTVAFAAQAADQNDSPAPPPKSYIPVQPPSEEIGPAQTDTMARPWYEVMARNALAARPKNFDFDFFRDSYGRTENYDPISQDAKNRLLDTAYAIQNEKDAARRAKLLDEYAALLSTHLANIDVVDAALVLSEQDRRFGDPQFLEWMRGGLIKSVMSSGDGTNLFRAYDVITMGEAPALLRALHLKVLSVDTRESAGQYYNMYSVADSKHTAPYTIFIDTTKPMSWLAEEKNLTSPNVFIPKQ